MSETSPNVIPFPSSARGQGPGHTGERAISSTTVRATGGRGTLGATALAPTIDIDRLYEGDSDSMIVVALEMLGEASTLLKGAQQAEDQIASDRFVQHLQLLLPRLFDCRPIGDGFGIIVSSLQFALDQLHGDLLRPEQIAVMRRIIGELRTHPAMSFDQALQHVSELEENGLSVDPPDLETILDSFPA